MAFLLTFPLSTTVFQPPPPVTTVFDFTSTVPAGVTVVRSGAATHITVAGYVSADPANLGRIDCDAVLDGIPAGSVSVGLTSVSSIGLANTQVTASGHLLDPAVATGSAGNVLRQGFTQLNLSGTAAAGAAGSPTIGSVGLVGSTATGAVSFGTVAVSEFIGIPGNVSTFTLGGMSVATTGSAGLVGIAASGFVAFVPTASVPPILSGLFGTGSAAFLPVSNTPSPLVGNSAPGAAGTAAASAVRIPGTSAFGVPSTGTILISKTLASTAAVAASGGLTAGLRAFSSGFSGGFR